MTSPTALLGQLGKLAIDFQSVARDNGHFEEFQRGLDVLRHVLLDGPMRRTETAIAKENVFVAVPRYGPVEWAMACAILNQVHDPENPRFEPEARSISSSLLANGFNRMLCACLNEEKKQPGRWHRFAMCHADIVPRWVVGDNLKLGWLDGLAEEQDRVDAWIIHAVAAIKDMRFLTSTGVGDCDDEWGLIRRLTIHEIHQLPETFNVRDVMELPGPWPQNPHLVPNTGCHMMRVDARLRQFALERGYVIKDRIVENPNTGELVAQVVPEDWGVGHWCGQHSIPVWGTTKIRIAHCGQLEYDVDTPCGQWEEDRHFLQIIGMDREHQPK